MYLFGGPFFVFSIFVIVFGILLTRQSFVEKIVKVRNDIQGVKTKITPTTIKYHKTAGIALIILGIILNLENIKTLFYIFIPF